VPNAFDEMFVRGRCLGPDGAEYVTTRKAQLGETVVVVVNGLARFRPEGIDLTRVVLFLDGQPLKGLSIPSSSSGSRSTRAIAIRGKRS
jgi:hypothetical protein